MSRPVTACQGMLLLLRGAPWMGEGTVVSSQGISISVSKSGNTAVPVTPLMERAPASGRFSLLAIWISTTDILAPVSSRAAPTLSPISIGM